MACQEAQSAAAGFCGACRSRLAHGGPHGEQAIHPPEGERKLVTVLCVALSDLPAPGKRLELDALHTQMRGLYNLIQRVV
jgi:hypothetical protein